MHVLIIPSWYPHHPTDPHGSFFRDQAVALHASGLKVGVAAVELHSMRDFGRKRIDGRIDVEVDEGVPTLRKRGWSWFPNMNLGNLFLWKMHSASLLKSYVAQFGLPDVIHAHSLNMGGIIAARFARECDRPLVITEHNAGYILRPNIPTWDLREYERLFRFSNANIAVSRALAGVMNRQWPEANCLVVPNMVEPSFYSQPLTPQLGEDIRFLTVGHLTARKNIALLIESFAAAEFSRPSRLTIVGEGEERGSLEELARHLGVADAITFKGRVARDQMAPLMADHDVFVLSSDAETFGVVVAEALAVGLTVVSTRCGGPEDIVDETNGILVEVGDKIGLTKSLAKMSDAIFRYNKNEIRHNSNLKFSGESVSKTISQVYRDSIENHCKL